MSRMIPGPATTRSVAGRNPMIIGNKWTPVRRVVDRAGAMVKVDKLCFCMVVEGKNLAGLFAGTPDTTL